MLKRKLILNKSWHETGGVDDDGNNDDAAGDDDDNVRYIWHDDLIMAELTVSFGGIARESFNSISNLDQKGAKDGEREREFGERVVGQGQNRLTVRLL